MPLAIIQSDKTDTTEEAILALVKQQYDQIEQAGLLLQPTSAEAFERDNKLAALQTLATLIAKGAHWNAPGVAVA
jgi:hypothetical protein